MAFFLLVLYSMLMSNPYENIRTRFELFSPMNAEVAEDQRGELLKRYSERGLVDPQNPTYITDNPVEDIANIRRDGMTPFVNTVIERTRSGEVLDIQLTPETVAKDIFATIAKQDGHERPALFVRYVSEDRLPIAVETGTDRDATSKLDYHGGHNEAQVMREYAVYDPADITYITDIQPDDGPMSLADGQAMLVYAVEPLQPLTPYKGDRHGSIGLAAFVDKRLKEKALLAVVKKAEKNAPVIGGTAITGLDNL